MVCVSGLPDLREIDYDHDQATISRSAIAEQLRREVIDDELLDQLMTSSSERGVALTGEGVLLPELVKAVPGTGYVQAELTDHLGYGQA